MLSRNGPVRCFLCRADRKGGRARFVAHLPVQPEPFAWQADHVVPLWSVPRDVPLNRRACFWGPVNLWVLCQACHARKTRAEAATRAALKSPQARLDGF